MIVEYIFDLILYWASYNFLHIIKLNYINPLIGLNAHQEYFNNNQNNRPVEDNNGRNLIFYLIIIVICLIALKVLKGLTKK